MIKGIIQQIYPPICVLCGIASDSINDLCHNCTADFRINDSACNQCALPLPATAQGQLCGQCLQKPPKYDAAWSAFIYAQPLEWMIQQLKFNSRLNFAKIISALAIPHLPDLDDPPDCIIPVPLHPKRLKERGFNQALELLRPIAKKLAVPMDVKSCCRQTYTTAQTALNARHRRKNIRNAFTFKNTRKYRYVVLFDDVITTGSTMNELVKTIKRQGVKRVDVWSLARAEKSFQKKIKIITGA